MLKSNFKRIMLFCIIGVLSITQGFARQDTLHTAISLYELFKLPESDPDDNFQAASVATTGSSNGEINVKVYSNIIMGDSSYINPLLYAIIIECKGSNCRISKEKTYYPWAVDSLVFGKIGERYPQSWSSDDIKSSVLATKDYYVTKDWYKRQEQLTALITQRDPNGSNLIRPSLLFNDFLGSTIPVKVIIDIPNGIDLTDCKLPGIGLIYKDNSINPGLKFDPRHTYHSNGDMSSPAFDEWYFAKNPSLSSSSDLIIAAHRGFWGNHLGTGPIENTKQSITAAKNYTHYMEVDIMNTHNNKLIVSHDYTLARVTDWEIDWEDTDKFVYNVNFEDIPSNVHLRRRNYFDIDRESTVLTLDSLLRYMKEDTTVLKIDIKERFPRFHPITGRDNNANNQAITPQTRVDDYIKIVSVILDDVKNFNNGNGAWEYVAIKPLYSMNEIKMRLPREKYRDLSKILFFPVLLADNGADIGVTMIDDWYNNAPNYLVGIETNFKKPSDAFLKKYIDTRDGNKEYDNVLHYLVEKTGTRPGLYSEEPTGPKGVSDRYAQWRSKNTTEDYRGDHFWLMENVPYFHTAIVTTDRPDIWIPINNIYNPNSQPAFLSSRSESVITIIDQPIEKENSKITARYSTGSIIIAGLNKNDTGNPVSLYNLQGSRLYQNRITTEPQMQIPLNIPNGIYILRISGNRNESIKLIVKQ
jgi:glycerophosphoryl diester phosphodiesterase